MSLSSASRAYGFGARFSGRSVQTFVCVIPGGEAAHHEAQVSPLIEEIAVDTDTVGFGEIIRDQLPDGGEIGGFLAAVVLSKAKLGRQT